MGTIYAIANQKGGVGKTTTAVNAAACVAEAGYPTLLVDVDPQCNATVGLGLAKDLEPSIYDVLAGDAALDDAVRPSGLDGLDVVPSSPDLAGASVELPRIEGSETRLRDLVRPARERYAFVFLDCPPSGRWWPPIGCWCRSRPSTTRSRGWPACSRPSSWFK